MPRSYPDEAVSDGLKLYLKFNGQQHDRIQQQMRQTWPGWSKQNLYTRGKGSQQKIGWIEKYGWEQALRLHLATRPESSRTAAEQIFHEIDEIRRKLFEQIKAAGARADKDLVYQHRAYTKLSIDALSKMGGAGNTLESFVAMWERLLDWLPEISNSAAIELLKVAEQVIERATAEYGNQEDSDISGSKY